jgi:hypothetical protein
MGEVQKCLNLPTSLNPAASPKSIDQKESQICRALFPSSIGNGKPALERSGIKVSEVIKNSQIQGDPNGKIEIPITGNPLGNVIIAESKIITPKAKDSFVPETKSRRVKSGVPIKNSSAPRNHDEIQANLIEPIAPDLGNFDPTHIQVADSKVPSLKLKGKEITKNADQNTNNKALIDSARSEKGGENPIEEKKEESKFSAPTKDITIVQPVISVLLPKIKPTSDTKLAYHIY